MRVGIIGGGLSGMAAALRLRERGHQVTLVEGADELGGLARSFERDGRTFPVAYHHVLATDRRLLQAFDELGLGDRVRWKHPGVAIRRDGRTYAMSNPLGTLLYPIALQTKLRLLRLAASAYRRGAPSDVRDLDARSWLLDKVGEEALHQLFGPMMELRFGVPLDQLSAAYVLERIIARESSAALGYVPGENWTELLVRGLAGRLQVAGVEVLLGRPAGRLVSSQGAVTGVRLEDGHTLPVDAVVSTVPPTVFRRLAPDHDAPWLEDLQTVDVVSCVVCVHGRLPLRHYWTTCLMPRFPFDTVFRLDRLNRGLAPPGTTLLNFATYLGASDPFGWEGLTGDQVLERYVAAFHVCFGVPIDPVWYHLERIPCYTPVYRPGFAVAPVRSERLSNLYFAGNFRTFPRVATTGSAILSGEAAAAAVDGAGPPAARGP